MINLFKSYYHNRRYKIFFLCIIQLIITEIIHHLDIIPIIPQLVITVFMNQSIALIFIKIYIIIIRYTNLCILEMIKLEVHLIITLIINNKLKKTKGRVFLFLFKNLKRTLKQSTFNFLSLAFITLKSSSFLSY